jgi:hypothetical protein
MTPLKTWSSRENPLVISKTRPLAGQVTPIYTYVISTFIVHFAQFEPIIDFIPFFANKLLHTLLHSRMFWWTLSR